MENDTIKLLNNILYFRYKDSDWKSLELSRKGFYLLFNYLEYLQKKVDELEKKIKECE